MSIKIFFHSSDLDGMCSGAIVKYKYPDAELFGINYGQSFPYDKVTKEDTIIMVDFSLQPFSEMAKLASFVGMDKLIWIDHHISTINEANNFELTQETKLDLTYAQIPMNQTIENKYSFNDLCPGTRTDGKAACELTWEYFFPDVEMPKAVKLLGRYDVWDLEDPQVLEFQFGMRLENTDPNNQLKWKQYFVKPFHGAHDQVKNTKINGRLILAYQKQENEKYAKSCAFEVKFEGYNAICINKLLTNSQLFESVYDITKHDIMIAFGLHKNGLWTFSFYTTKEGVDCSSIAKKHGGGGHRGAAGCQFKIPPLQFQKQIKLLQPVKFEDIPDYGEKFTIEEFKEDVSHGMYIDMDGGGYYATEDKMTDIPILPSHFASDRIDERFGFVIWFNK